MFIYFMTKIPTNLWNAEPLLSSLFCGTILPIHFLVEYRFFVICEHKRLEKTVMNK